MAGLRTAAAAGSWYPGTRKALEAAVDAHMSAVQAVSSDRPCAIITPHAGLRYSGPVAAYAYGALRGFAYGTAVLVGPSHFVPFHGVSIWPDGAWETPLGPVAVDHEMAAALTAASSAIVVQLSVHLDEHSLEMQLPFLARLQPDVAIVPLLMGAQTRETALSLGDDLARVIAISRRPTLLVASTDLSHYEDAHTAFSLDSIVMRHVEGLDPEGLMEALEREPRHACGGGPMVAVLRAARALGATRARVLRYADSGDVSGDKSSVVGYMAAGVW
jgi:MEMO1 family protein